MQTPSSPDGTILASMVTDKDTADSPVFVKLCNKIPKGNGPALGYSAYCSSDNCDAAIAKCIDAYFEPKKNHAGKATSSWAKMVRFWKGHPGRFYKNLQGQNQYILNPPPSGQYVARCWLDGRRMPL